MRKPFYNCCFLTLFILLTAQVSAQFSTDNSELNSIEGRWEISATIGANNFMGDLGGNKGKGKPFAKDYMFKTMQPLAGISAERFMSNWLGLKIGFNYTAVDGADSLINNTGDLERWRWYRNLSFFSTVFEGYIAADIFPVMLFDKVSEIHKVSPFIGIGVGFFHFKPQAPLNGKWIDLQPLNLEGQGFSEYPDRKPYKLTQLYIPINLGVKYYINEKYSFSIGVNFRHTSTDYIDDISTTYIDPTLFDKYLTPDNATLAKQLYSRSLTPWKVKPDLIKAKSSDNDTYVTMFFTLSIRFKRYYDFYYGGQ